jgi:hypothetical protein
VAPQSIKAPRVVSRKATGSQSQAVTTISVTAVSLRPVRDDEPDVTDVPIGHPPAGRLNRFGLKKVIPGHHKSGVTLLDRHRGDCICGDLVNALTGSGGSEKIVGLSPHRGHAAVSTF